MVHKVPAWESEGGATLRNAWAEGFLGHCRDTPQWLWDGRVFLVGVVCARKRLRNESHISSDNSSVILLTLSEQGLRDLGGEARDDRRTLQTYRSRSTLRR